MKKTLFRWLTPLMCGAMLTAAMPSIAMADTSKIVTLGADLSDSEKQTMMNYFNVSSSEAQIISVTNSDEKTLLGSYIPASQIGTRTVSCAYVKPTTSGGIKVRTANLNYVTCNMLASALMTAGVSNAEVVAACPYNVSGTGALTGVMLAYEQASGTELSSDKKKLATEELVTTGKTGDRVTDENGDPIGRDKAILILNEMKYEILSEGITDHDLIYERLAELVSDYNYTMNEEDGAAMMDFLIQFADLNYAVEDLEDTINTIQKNISGEPIDESVEEKAQEEAAESSDEESILNNTDESLLGSDIIVSDSDNPEIYEETASQAGVDTTTVLSGYEDVDETAVAEDGSSDTSSDDAVPAEELYYQLDDTSRARYDEAAKFADGEFAGDADALATEMGSDFIAGATIDADTAASLKAKFLEVYEDLLLNGFVQDDSVENPYLTTELNVLKQKLITVFGLNTENYDQTADVLVSYDTATKQALYDDTMKFFEKLYGETLNTETTDDSTVIDDGSNGTYDEETYTEEGYTGEEGTYDEGAATDTDAPVEQ